jgi:hypothetical protein
VATGIGVMCKHYWINAKCGSFFVEADGLTRVRATGL